MIRQDLLIIFCFVNRVFMPIGFEGYVCKHSFCVAGFIMSSIRGSVASFVRSRDNFQFLVIELRKCESQVLSKYQTFNEHNLRPTDRLLLADNTGFSVREIMANI